VQLSLDLERVASFPIVIIDELVEALRGNGSVDCTPLSLTCSVHADPSQYRSW
jgi:hypothetical protein